MSLDQAPTTADLLEIAEQVWSSYLDVEGTDPLIPTGPSGFGGDMVASVSITGGWNGHVVVSCSWLAARHAAAAFLMMGPDEVTNDDLIDVLGELANIVGGNVKSMLPASSNVSLPHVVVSTDTDIRWPACTQICELAGTWRDEHISISMWQSSARSGARAA